MKTTVSEAGKADNKVNNSAVNANVKNNGTQPKTNSLPLSKELDKKLKDEVEQTNADRL